MIVFGSIIRGVWGYNRQNIGSKSRRYGKIEEHKRGMKKYGKKKS